MDIVLCVLAVALVLAGIAGCFLPLMPGPPLSYVGLLSMYFTSWNERSVTFLIVWALITIVVTLTDYYLPVYMTKRFGGSKYATWGTAVGVVAGIFVYPPLGVIVMPFVGALIGEMIHDGSDKPKAFKVALGSFLAFILGSGAKLIVSLIMAFYVIKAVILAFV